jgi:aspartate kinase
MSRLVMKFGGTSVADLERIRAAATRVKREVEGGHEVAVVVSAMAGKTNELVDWVRQTSRLYDAREYDAVVASGENVTAGLMALTLQEMGVPARSWQGWQVPVRTTSAHGGARIEAIETERLEAKFAEGLHAVIAGFQGVSPEGRITTLGRGGSDTSAVAFAAALNADRCDIYTDVDGVYTTDPRITKKARKLGRISYEEMLELASLGAKVLQTRSVELAMRYNVRLQVLSSFSDSPGTLVCSEEEIVESRVVSGIAHTRDEAQVTVAGVQDKPGMAAAIFGPLAAAGVNVDMIVQNVAADGRTDMTFTVPIDGVARALQSLETARGRGEIDFLGVHANEDVAKVSIVGIGMRSHAGVAHQMFAALAAENINIKVITTSEIKVSVLVDRKYLELAVQALHDAFGLDRVG